MLEEWKGLINFWKGVMFYVKAMADQEVAQLTDIISFYVKFKKSVIALKIGSYFSKVAVPIGRLSVNDFVFGHAIISLPFSYIIAWVFWTWMI